jgi:hypothetical protein
LQRLVESGLPKATGPTSAVPASLIKAMVLLVAK